MEDNVKYTNILIISDQYINDDLFKDFDYMVVQEFEFKKPFMGVSKGQYIEFYVLIKTDMLLKNVMREDGYIITNENFEPSVDGYFAIGNTVKSNKSLDEQFNIILDYLKGNE